MRARVNERLVHATRFPVTLIVAPAGFGKSVALRDFIATSRLEPVRYDVRREDGALLAFVRRFSEALEPVAPGALASFPAMQERVLASEEPVRQLSDWFAEHLKKTVGTIVIDDLHYAAADPASIALLADVIERTTERIKWIIAARSDVGLPVATWIAYGRMDVPIGEDDLRFTTDEALLAAEQHETKLDPDEIEELRRLTEGWPVALTIALRTRTHSHDLRTAAFSTREMVYRYLAEQIFSSLSLSQRAFALATCVFSSFDRSIAETLGAAGGFLDDFRARIAFLNETAPGEYRYHDLFRDFLEAELRRRGEQEWTRTLCDGARLLYRRHDAGGALALFAKARANDDLLRIVEEHGFALFARGEGEKIAQALDVLPESQRRESAIATGLRAMIDASLGRFEVAEPAYLAAIKLAENDRRLRFHLVLQYAIELVRLDRACVALLEPYARDESIENAYRAPLLATLATGYLRAGRGAEALDTVHRALGLLDAGVSDEARTRIYQQSAYVERYAGSCEKARAYASTAIELALAHNLYDLAARAYSVLYTIVRDTTDDPIESLTLLDRLSECARKSASAHARLFALVATYEIEVERGDDETLEQLDEFMRAQQSMLPMLRTTTVLSVHALRAAWAGEFAKAHEMVAGTAHEQSTGEQRALRAAEAALYAAAAGRHEEAEDEAREAAKALQSSAASNKHAVRARLTLAVAQMLLGHDASANRLISEAERSWSGMARMRAFGQAVRTLYRVRLGQAQEQHWQTALERLRSEHFGGVARLLSALPVGMSGGAYASLTSAEREILQLLARGASTKDVAVKTGRSPHTVDTHIRSICRKLSCSGRREAVALASSHGWVEA